MLNEFKLVLDNSKLGELEDQLMELPAKHANPILSWLAGEIGFQRHKGTTVEEVTTVYVDTDRVDCPTDGIARKFVKKDGSKVKRKITKL